MKSRLLQLVGALLLALVLFLVYRPALSCPFFYDEGPLIMGNNFVRDGDWVNALLSQPTRGLSFASYALTTLLSGSDPVVWRGLQLLLHGLTSCLIGLLVYSVSSPSLSRVGAALGTSATLSMAFHPLSVESAVYLWSRPSLACSLLCLLGFFLLWILHPSISPLRRFASVAVILGLSALSLLAKEVGILVVLPVLLLVLFTLDRRSFLYALVSSLCFIFILAVMLYCVESSVTLTVIQERLVWSRVREQFWQQTLTLWYNLKLLIPLPRQYTLDHMVERHDSVPVFISGCLLLLVWFSALLLAVWKRLVLVSFGLAIPLFSLFPYFIIPSIPLVEYKTYPLLIGMVFVLSGLLAPYLTTRRRIKLVLSIYLVFLFSSVLLTIRQVETWRNPSSVWQNAILVNPDNPSPRVSLAFLAMEEGRDEEALPLLQASLKSMGVILERSGMPIESSWAWGVYNYGRFEQKRGFNGMAKYCYLLSLQINPEYRPTLYALALLLAEEGRIEEGIPYFTQFESLCRDSFEQEKLEVLKRFYRP